MVFWVWVAISNILLFLCLKEHNFQSLSCHNTCEMFLQPLWPTLQPQNISRRDLLIVMVINVVCCINVSLMSRHMLCFLLYVVLCCLFGQSNHWGSTYDFTESSKCPFFQFLDHNVAVSFYKCFEKWNKKIASS